MAEETILIKNPVLNADEDYAFLRSKGLQYIEELGSRLWTDYNEHDPGITILEALCFAITELGYRAGLPMKDLLTGNDGKISSSQALFTPKNILTQAPLTSNDYRKLLIDIPGINNAWLFAGDSYTTNDITTPAAEVPFFADCKKDSLTFETTPHPVYISGLYKALLDLEDDPQAGNLNNGELEVLSPAITDYKAGAVSFTVILPAWNDTNVNTGLLQADKDSLSNVIASVTADGKNWKLSVDFSFQIKNDAATHTATLEAGIIIDLKPSGKTITLADMQAFFSASFAQQIINLYIYKIQESKRIVQTAVKKLHENRNLCEDFISVDTIPDEEIAICCDIDITSDTDMDDVQAKVFYAIEQYLNPPVHFYLLKDLVSKGYTTDEIFEGPKLEHGFIDTVELEKAQLRQTIYASDIISLIMDIPGVQAVRGFRMTKYDKAGKAVATQTGKAWCMPVTLWHKPLFSETRSKIIFYKNRFPYLPVLNEVRDTLRWLHAVNRSNKLTGHADDLSIPVGTYIKLDEYTSINSLFPQTYGIGSAGLPPNATEERKAQVKQLKAYLLFYDQLLADFFSQLQGAKALFSTDAIVQTYYGQYLDDIKDITEVYKEDGSANSLLQAVLSSQDSSLLLANDWQKLYETNQTFTDRRNRFLDHLMARFAESFNDYVLLMYSLDYDTQQETKITPSQLANNKIDFIKAYPQLSYERAKATNYFPLAPANTPQNFTVNTAALWNTDNVSGLEKKSARLAGITDITRRFLYCFTQADIIATTDSPAKFQFVFTDENGNTITSATTYETEVDAASAIASFIELAKNKDHYSIEISGAKQQVIIKDNNGNKQALSNDFDDEVTANTAIENFVLNFKKECNSEGLHLVEHLLLRPRNTSFVLPPVCLDADCDFCGEQDPFSFRMSVILPYWPVHFKNMAFRDYFENMMRREAPAHTLVKICWLNNEDMRRFEVAYKNWLAAIANYTADKATINILQIANDALINILFYLHSEYPVATLHDCEDSRDTNPVMLGRTILGSFKTQ